MLQGLVDKILPGVAKEDNIPVGEFVGYWHYQDSKLEAAAEAEYMAKLALENKEQVILFQNRRGYTPILLCRTCGFLPKCINCDVSLTYHKTSGKLHCHYCGYHQSSINICPACGSVHIEQKGFGTERI